MLGDMKNGEGGGATSWPHRGGSIGGLRFLRRCGRRVREEVPPPAPLAEEGRRWSTMIIILYYFSFNSFMLLRDVKKFLPFL